MKKYLIVSGCSWGDPNFISAEHPDMDTSQYEFMGSE